MKLNRLFFIVCLYGFFMPLSADHIRWYGDYEKALLIAKEQNKPLMLFLRKEKCQECKKMIEITLSNQDYIKYLNKNFIGVIATYEEENSYPIEMFYTLDFPALFFVSSKDESFLCDPLFGYVTPKGLSDKIKTLR